MQTRLGEIFLALLVVLRYGDKVTRVAAEQGGEDEVHFKLSNQNTKTLSAVKFIM